jgi:hypothetical protein
MLRTEWSDRARLVEPYIGVKLLGQDCLAVVAPQLSIGTVDHADEALQPRLGEAAAERFVPVW